MSPLPTDLAGYQNVVKGFVQEDDLLIPIGAMSAADWQWASIWEGASILMNGSIESSGGGYHVYRKIPVAKQGDSDPSGAVELPRAALSTEAAARKRVPLATGVLDYFPAALCAIAECSRVGNEQHNPDQPLHWNRSKSGDESDALMRHFLQRHEMDSDGVLHATKVAWRALAFLQKKLEADGKKT